MSYIPIRLQGVDDLCCPVLYKPNMTYTRNEFGNKLRWSNADSPVSQQCGKLQTTYAIMYHIPHLECQSVSLSKFTTILPSD